MAEFGAKATSLADPQAAGSTPHGGYTSNQIRTDVWQGLENKGAMAAGAIGFAATLFGEKEDKVNPVLRDLTVGLDTLVQAKEQGLVSESEANSRTRLAAANALRRAGGDPELTKLIKQNVDAFMGTTGLSADDSHEEELQKTLDDSIVKDLQDMGFPVIANPSEDLLAAYRAAHASIKSASADTERTAKAVALAQSKVNLSEDQKKNVATNAANDSISKMLPQMTDVLRQTSLDLREKVKQGLPINEAMMQLKALSDSMRGQLQMLYPAAPQYVSSTMSYLDSYNETLVKALDPKTEEDALQSQYNTTVLQDKIFLQSFPDMRLMTAVEPLVRNNPLMFEYLNKTVMDAAMAFTNRFDPSKTPPVRPTALGSTDRTQLYGFGKDAIKTAMSLIADQQSGKRDLGGETTNNIVNNLLASSANVSTGDRISQSKEFVDFLASGEFKVWRQQGELSPDALAAAQRMFDQQYLRGIQQPILNALDKKVSPYRKTDTSIDIAYKDILDVDFQNGRVVFNARNIPGEDTKQTIIGREFVNDVKKQENIVNTLIRAGANLKNVPVEQYWKENKSKILPAYYPPKMPNLKIGDVVDGMEYIGGVVSSRYSWKKVSSNAGTD